jgi:predicted Zn-dependent protease
MARLVSYLGRLLFVIALISLSACENSNNTDTQISCPSINANQSGSFMAKVSAFPVSVQADSTFTADQQNTLQAAVQAWNDFGQSVMGSDIFQLSVVDIDDATRSLDPHVCTENYGDAGHLVLIREADAGHWRQLIGATSQQVPGVTIRCSSSGIVTEQMTVINTDLSQSSSLGQIFTHELGHALGLDHSCNGAVDAKSTASYISCSDVAANDPYREAVMFPWIQSMNDSMPLLRDNDKARASCMMESTAQ